MTARPKSAEELVDEFGHARARCVAMSNPLTREQTVERCEVVNVTRAALLAHMAAAPKLAAEKMRRACVEAARRAMSAYEASNRIEALDVEEVLRDK